VRPSDVNMNSLLPLDDDRKKTKSTLHPMADVLKTQSSWTRRCNPTLLRERVPSTALATVSRPTTAKKMNASSLFLAGCDREEYGVVWPVAQVLPAME
jgi:hypothetical protein